MRIDEVTKALCEGSKSTFKTKKYTLRKEYDEIVMRDNEDDSVAYCFIPLDGWEEIKPQREWSEKELALFKLLPEQANWIVRTHDGKLFLTKHNQSNPLITIGYCKMLPDDNLFDFITLTFEEGPQYIGDLKGE